jgi:hypothetical protein
MLLDLCIGLFSYLSIIVFHKTFLVHITQVKLVTIVFLESYLLVEGELVHQRVDPFVLLVEYLSVCFYRVVEQL